MSDNPFDVFGSESEQEEEDITPLVAQKISRTLVAAANQRQRKESPPKDDFVAKKDPSSNESLSIESIPFPFACPPLYLGPMALVQASVGGGRGVVATEDLPTGTLVLVERPVYEWQEDTTKTHSIHVETVRTMLSEDEGTRTRLMADLRHLHPMQLEDNDEAMLEYLQKEIESSVLRELGDLARNAVGGDINTVLRLLLALRYNGLESGIYLYVAMLNHDCTPNCVKFAPDGHDFSEVRTTRPVRAGERLTFSYVPRIVSHATRRYRLWNQHRFDIQDCMPKYLRAMEYIGGKLPRSSLDALDEETATSRIESATLELEDHCAALKEDLINNADQEQAKALEQASLELCAHAIELLRNPQHLLLVPILKLHMDACNLVMAQHDLTSQQLNSLLSRLVTSGIELVPLLRKLYGPDHFDLAAVQLDLCQTVDELLSRAPQSLVALQREDLGSVAAWSKLSHTARQDFERIERLYPHDALEKIQSQQ